MVRRDYPPGMHGWRRGKFTEYGQRLREKQRLKRHYGLLERQFRRYFDLASRAKGNTGETLLILLERRLDNVVYRAGFALSHANARQLIAHGHVLLNGRKHTFASTLVRPNDVIQPGNKAKSLPAIKANIEASKGRTLPSWLELQEDTLNVRMIGLPASGEIKELIPIREHLIVELCSR
jgi:small subunit ribosomal protein S4